MGTFLYLVLLPLPLRPLVINTWSVTFEIIFLYSTASLDCLAQPWLAARLHHHRSHAAITHNPRSSEYYEHSLFIFY